MMINSRQYALLLPGVRGCVICSAGQRCWAGHRASGVGSICSRVVEFIHQGNPESAPMSLSTLGMQEVVWSPMVPLEALGGASIFDSQC